MQTALQALTLEWRADAEILRKWGVTERAELIDQLAAAVEAALTNEKSARVGLETAVAISGYTRGHLRRLMKSGRLENLGTEQKPEFLVADLPRKTGDAIAKKTLAPKGAIAANFKWQAARAALFGGQANATSEEAADLELHGRKEGKKSRSRL